MTRLFTNKRLLVLLASLIVLVVVASLTLRPRDQLSLPEKIVLDSFSTVQRYLYQPAAKISDTIDSLRKINELYKENQVLKANLDNYIQVKARADQLEQENKRYEAALGFKSDHKDYNVMPAVVTGHSLNEWNSVIQINVGSRDGVKKDMPVITFAGGLVGRVTDVGELSSKVLLITDTEKTGISAQVLNGKDQPTFGIVSGSTEPGTVKMGMIRREDPVEVGQQVITSPLSVMFPKGLVIGQVTKLVSEETGLTKTVLIKPAADIDHLEDVFVVFLTKP